MCLCDVCVCSPEGFYQDVKGQIACDVCPGGKYGASGDDSYMDYDECKTCPAGDEYLPSWLAMFCQLVMTLWLFPQAIILCPLRLIA